MAFCLIGLGTNLGDRAALLDQAISALTARGDVRLVARSRSHATRPVGGPSDQPSYLNAAVVVESTLPPMELLAHLQDVERRLGRERLDRWGPRTIDLDLLLCDQAVIETDTLQVPHPRMSFRRFVLQPAAEVALEMRHPVIGWTVGQLLEHLDSARDRVAIVGEATSPEATELAVQLERMNVGVAVRSFAAHSAAAHSAAAQGVVSSPGTQETVAGGNPAGRDFQRWVEFLGDCRRLVDADQSTDGVVISDFWWWASRPGLWPNSIDTHGAGLVREGGENDSLRRLWEQLRPQLPPTKLLIALGPSPECWRSRRSVPCEDAGPTLVLTTGDPRNVEEVVAAVASCRLSK